MGAPGSGRRKASREDIEAPFEGESTPAYWRRTWDSTVLAGMLIRVTRRQHTQRYTGDLAAQNEVPEGKTETQWRDEERAMDFAQRAVDKTLAQRIVTEATAAAQAAMPRMSHKAPTLSQINEHVERLVRELVGRTSFVGMVSPVGTAQR